VTDTSLDIIIMAGGSGTRFWPLSTKARPKQLLPLVTGEPLIVDSLRRLLGLTSAEHIRIITSEHLRETMAKHLEGLLDPKQVIAEPCQRDTAGCIALAAALIARENREGVMAIMTADHSIQPTERFQETVKAALDVAREDDAIVVFGVKPGSPSTLYGYIHRKGEPRQHSSVTVYDVESFREKPDAATAREYISSGEYYWNSGMFVWTVEHIIECFAKFLPDHHRFIEEFASSSHGPDEFADAFAALPKISIDYGIMEKAERVKVIEAPFEWDDVGSWPALARTKGSDANGNTIIGGAVTIDTTGSILYREDDGIIAAVGVKDLVIVSAGSAVLVCHKDETARIKEVVERLKEMQKEQFL